MEILWWWGDSTGPTHATLCLRVDTAGTVTTSLGGSVTLDPSSNYGIGKIELTGVTHGKAISILHNGVFVESGTVATLPADGDAFNIAALSCANNYADALVFHTLVRDHAVRIALFLGDTPYVDQGYDVARFQPTTVAGAYAADPTGAGGREVYDANHAAFRRVPAVAAIMHSAICYGIIQDHDIGDDWTHDYLLANDDRTSITTQAQADAVYNNAYTSWRAWWSIGNPANTDSEVAEWKPSSAAAGTPSSNYPASYARKRIGGIELFLLDCITYRCSQTKTDTGTLIEADAAAKTQLGRPQKAWLKARTTSSDADYLLICSGESTHEGGKTSDNCDWSSYLSERNDLISHLAALPQGVGWVGGDTHTPHVIDTGSHFCVTGSPVGQADQSGAGSVDLGDGYVDGYVWKPRGNPGYSVMPQPRCAGVIRVTADRLVWDIVTDYNEVVFSGMQLAGAKTLTY